MSHDYNPALEPCYSEYHNPECCMVCGPAGNTTLVNGNEKGILEENIFKVEQSVSPMAATHQKWSV